LIEEGIKSFDFLKEKGKIDIQIGDHLISILNFNDLETKFENV
jgi:hypothetical protein